MSRRSEATKVWVVDVNGSIWGVFSKEKKALKATKKLDDANIKWTEVLYQVDWRAN